MKGFPMFYRSSRLFLRPAFPEDWEAVKALMTDEIARNLGSVPWPYSEAEAREFVALPQNPCVPHFLVTIPGEGVIGSAGLGSGGCGAEIGYWIGRKFWGQGYASEAARALVEIAAMLGHKRLSACHFADNLASGAVLRKAGFAATGDISPRFSKGRGHEVMSHIYELELDTSLIREAA